MGRQDFGDVPLPFLGLGHRHVQAIPKDRGLATPGNRLMRLRAASRSSGCTARMVSFTSPFSSRGVPRATI